MAEPARRAMTVEEFLAFTDGTDTRYELVGGELVATAPPLERHSVVAFAVAVAIDRRLPRGCRGLVEAGIRLDAHTLFQADLAVSCAPLDANGLVRDPVLIVEVLSDSTRRFDLGEKADRYSQLPIYPAYHMAQSLFGLKAAWEKAQARKGGERPTTEEVIAAFEGLEFPTPSTTVRMALGLMGAAADAKGSQLEGVGDRAYLLPMAVGLHMAKGDAYVMIEGPAAPGREVLIAAAKAIAGKL